VVCLQGFKGLAWMALWISCLDFRSRTDDLPYILLAYFADGTSTYLSAKLMG